MSALERCVGWTGQRFCAWQRTLCVLDLMAISRLTMLFIWQCSRRFCSHPEEILAKEFEILKLPSSKYNGMGSIFRDTISLSVVFPSHQVAAADEVSLEFSSGYKQCEFELLRKSCCRQRRATTAESNRMIFFRFERFPNASNRLSLLSRRQKKSEKLWNLIYGNSQLNAAQNRFICRAQTEWDTEPRWWEIPGIWRWLWCRLYF